MQNKYLNDLDESSSESTDLRESYHKELMVKVDNITKKNAGHTIFLNYREYLQDLYAEGREQIGAIFIRLSEILKSGNCPNGLTINYCNFEQSHYDDELECAGIVEDISLCLIPTLESGKCPSNLKIDLSNNFSEYYEPICQSVGGALITGNCPMGLTIDLSNNELVPEIDVEENSEDSSEEEKSGIFYLCKALQSGNCPSDLTLKLCKTGIECGEIEELVETLLSGNCPPNLTLDLSNNQIEEDGIAALITLIQSTKCPLNLTLYLKGVRIYKEQLLLIKESLLLQKSPQIITMHFGYESNKSLKKDLDLHQTLFNEISEIKNNNSRYIAFYYTCKKVLPTDILKNIGFFTLNLDSTKANHSNYIEETHNLVDSFKVK